MKNNDFTLEQVQVLITEECDAIRDLLIEKNKSKVNKNDDDSQ